MDQEAEIDKLKRFIIRELQLEDVSVETFADDTPLFGDGIGLDSIDVVELVVLLRREYGIEMQLEDAMKEAFTSVTSLQRFIDQACRSDKPGSRADA